MVVGGVDHIIGAEAMALMDRVQAHAEAILQVNPQPGSYIDLRVDMFDKDPFGDDNFPVVIEDYAFETGWRRQVSVVTSQDGARMRLTSAITC